MSVVITREDLIAYAEVDYIINHMNERYRAKLPMNLLNFFETMKDPDYEIYVNPYIPLEEQGLSKYALEIIALLHIKYWCENQARKEELLEIMTENQEKFEAQLREKFSTDKLFGNNEKETGTNRVSTQDPVVTAYSKYTEENPDIHDFTDLREEVVDTNELPENVEKKKISIFGRMKLFFAKMFHKS